MIGILRLAAALICAAVLSQFPAFSDQYVQRLGGQVDALARVAADFDRSARRAGLTRAEALADLGGSAFRDQHRSDMAATFTRLETARADLTMLRLASPLERIALPHRLRDTQVLSATWADFSPAVPVTFAGLTAAAIGFFLGWLLFGLLMRPLRQQDRLGWR